MLKLKTSAKDILGCAFEGASNFMEVKEEALTRMRGLTRGKAAQDRLQTKALKLARPCFLAHSQAAEALMLLLKGAVACRPGDVKTVALTTILGADSPKINLGNQGLLKDIVWHTCPTVGTLIWAAV